MTKQKNWANYLLGLAVVLLILTNMATWLSIPDEKTLNISLLLFWLGLSIVLLFPKRKLLLGWAKSERGMKISRNMLVALLLFCFISLINYFVFKHPWAKDFTRNQRNTLSVETKKLLAQVHAPMHFKMFVKKSDQVAAMGLLELYRQQNSLIELEVVDPELHPELVQSYGITKYGTLYAEYLGRKNKIFEINELSISKGLLQLVQEKKARIYYLTGHGEINLEENGRDGGSFFKGLMIESSYELFPLDLKREKRVPKDADLLLIWGPREGFLAGELQHLEDYLVQQNGSMVVAIDPNFNNFKLKTFFQFLQDALGVHAENDVVVDFKSQVEGYDGTVPLIAEYNQEHPLTKGFHEQTFYPLALSLQLVDGEGFYQRTELMHSSPHPYSWGEKNFGEVVLKEVRFDEKTDIKGPLALAVALEQKGEVSKQEKRGRVVLFGNSTFVSNAYAQFGGNFTLALKSLMWPLQQEFSLGIQKVEEKDKISFLSSQEMGLIFYFSFVFAPLILLSLAVFFYWQKVKK